MGIIHGDCDHILNEYFDNEEVAEISDLVHAGPILWKNCTVDLHWDWSDQSKQDWLCSTKISNLTQKFGIMKDKDGKRIGVGYREPYVTYPSNWKYCSWKIKHAIDYGRLFHYMPDLFHCDGKCNTNVGDNQQWLMRNGKWYFGYIDVETGKRIFNGYPGMNPTEHKGSLITCIRDAERIMKTKVASYIFYHEKEDEKLDVDKIKMQLCKPFKTIVENCSIPISECIVTVYFW